MVTAAKKNDYSGPKTIRFTLDFYTINKRLKHIEFDPNYVELIICEKNHNHYVLELAFVGFTVKINPKHSLCC